MPRKFSDDLRSQAVRLVEQHIDTHNSSIAAACRAVAPMLGIAPDTLRGWSRDARRARAVTTQMSREELCQVELLRASLAEMERANEILKAPSALFAAEPGCPGPR